MVSKRCLFENHENRTWHQNQTFQESSALGPIKNNPKERFWKNMKNLWKHYRKSMVFDGPKPLKIIEKQRLFLILGHSKKRYQRGPQKKIWGSKMATWASQVWLIVWFLTFCCDAKKSSFLDAFPMDQKIEKIEPWSAKGLKVLKGRTPPGPPGTPRTPGTPPPFPHHRKRVPEDQASWRPSFMKTKLHEDQASDSDAETKTQTQIHRLRFRFRFKDSDSYQTQTRRLKDC